MNRWLSYGTRAMLRLLTRPVYVVMLGPCCYVRFHPNVTVVVAQGSIQNGQCRLNQYTYLQHIYSPPSLRPGPTSRQFVPVLLPDAGSGAPAPVPATLPRPCTAVPYPLFCTAPGAAPNQRFTVCGVNI